MKRNINRRTASRRYEEIYVEGDFDTMADDIVNDLIEDDGEDIYENAVVRFQMMLNAPDGLSAPYFAKNKKVVAENFLSAWAEVKDFIKECSDACVERGFSVISKMEVHPEWCDDGSIFIPMWPHCNGGIYGIPDEFTLDAYKENF